MTKPDKRDEIIAQDRKAFAESLEALHKRIDYAYQTLDRYGDRIQRVERRGIRRRILRAIVCAFEELFR